MLLYICVSWVAGFSHFPDKLCSFTFLGPVWHLLEFWVAYNGKAEESSTEKKADFRGLGGINVNSVFVYCHGPKVRPRFGNLSNIPAYYVLNVGNYYLNC